MKWKPTVKQVAFVEHYLITNSAKEAAIRAGYSKNGAKVTGCKLLTHPNLSIMIAEKMDKRSERLEIDADYVLKQAVEIHDRTMVKIPLLNEEGVATGEYTFDANNAVKSLKLIGEHTTVKAFDNNPSTKLDIEHKISVTLNATDRAARIADIFQNALIAHNKTKEIK